MEQQRKNVDRLMTHGEKPQREGGRGRGGGALARATRVKNKQPAPVQITAEAILRGAMERKEAEIKPPKAKITDPDELADYRLRKRKEFEDGLRRSKVLMATWVKYAQWEESQMELDRARSIWERALEVDFRNTTIWLKYAEMEMRHRNVNRARNVWDRCTTLLPRIDQFWYKYAYMEEMVGNIPGARNVFERWMSWHPEESGWTTYIKFELRYNEIEPARALYERFIVDHPTISAWLKYARFEEKTAMNRPNARAVYERAVADLDTFSHDERLFLAFAKFEEKARETDRARMIYRYALDHIPRDKASTLYSAFVAFEKQHGDREGIEDVIVSKRRFQYEEETAANPHSYDVWFDYIKLEMSSGSTEKARDVMERAIANRPLSLDKTSWRRYIYLWINYALFEELDCEDIERTRDVYRACLRMIPHAKFTFTKIWVMFAQFEIRQKDLKAARQIMGRAIGTAAKDGIFKAYIEMELQLGEVDRVRTIYEKWVDWNPANVACWTRFTELEAQLGEVERARAVFELGIEQPLLDQPEVLWKAYVDFEMDNEEHERARDLYKRLLERTSHVKVLTAAALFEARVGEVGRARTAFEEGHDRLKEMGSEHKEDRLLLLETFLEFEREHGGNEEVERVEKMMPKRLKKRRPIENEDGSTAGWEEYFDYIFPEEEGQGTLKILEMARKWKKQKAGE